MRGQVAWHCLMLTAVVACADRHTVADSAAAIGARPSARPDPGTTRYGDTLSIVARADSIDHYVAAHPERVALFAAVPGDTSIVAVKDSTSWPDETQVSYNAIVDDAGRPLLHVQMPTSESGDWFASERHYFAPDGRTILHVYEISGFASGCGDILRESKRTFLGPNGTAIAEVRRFTDAKGVPIVADSCYRRSDGAPAPKQFARDLPFPSSR